MKADLASPSKEESDEKAKEMVSRWKEVFNTEVMQEEVIIFDNLEASGDPDRCGFSHVVDMETIFQGAEM